jgi:hypothetical protein
MAICRECSDEGFVGYVMAIPFDAPAERDAWVSKHIQANSHTVVSIDGGWLSPLDVSNYMQSVNWASVDDHSALSNGHVEVRFEPSDPVHP